MANAAVHSPNLVYWQRHRDKARSLYSYVKKARHCSIYLGFLFDVEGVISGLLLKKRDEWFSGNPDGIEHVAAKS